MSFARFAILVIFMSLLEPSVGVAGHFLGELTDERSPLPAKVEPLTLENISLARIKEVVDSERPSSKADFLKLLPSACKKRYLLVHESRATYCSSYEKPRTIISCTEPGGETPLIIAVNGEPAEGPLPECQKAEIFETDEKTGSIKSAEITFSQKAADPYRYLAQPGRCTSCHGEPLRHLADRYPSWPGFYDSSRRNIRVGSPEWHGYQAFKKSRGDDPVFAQLIPYEERIKEAYGEKVLDPRVDEGSFTSAFFNAMNRTHSRRTGTWLGTHPQYQFFKYAIAGALMGCKNVEAFFPASLKSTPSLQAIDTHIRKGIERADENVLERLSRFNWTLTKEDQVGIFPIEEGLIKPNVGLAFVATRMGISPNFASSSFTPTEVTFPVDFPGSEFGKNLPNLPKGSCEELREKSLASIAGLPTSKPGPTLPRVEAQNALRKCMECHNQKMAKRVGAPKIPFDDTGALSALLRENPSLGQRILNRMHSEEPTRKMPPNENLNRAEFEAIETYVRDTLPSK